MTGAKLVIATHNPGKVTEVLQILRDQRGFADLPDDAVVTAGQLGFDAPVENGASFAENALIKARAIAEASGLPTLADDSGLAVDIMGGAPGIFSARWCGHHGDDAANLNLLLAQLAENTDPAQRRASFVCAVAVVAPDGTEFVEQGAMPGRLIEEPRGEGGFGYDPIFVPDDVLVAPGQPPRTSAELTPVEKNAISHRGKALRKVAPKLAQLLG